MSIIEFMHSSPRSKTDDVWDTVLLSSGHSGDEAGELRVQGQPQLHSGKIA